MAGPGAGPGVVAVLRFADAETDRSRGRHHCEPTGVQVAPFGLERLGAASLVVAEPVGLPVAEPGQTRGSDAVNL